MNAIFESTLKYYVHECLTKIFEVIWTSECILKRYIHMQAFLLEIFKLTFNSVFKVLVL